MNFAKVLLGTLLLIKMRKQLNYFYNHNKWEIIITIFMGIIASIWKILLNYYTPFLDIDLKFNFAARVKIPDHELPIQTLVMVIDIFLPILVIISNIKSNDFSKYIFNLMKGRQLTQYYIICSIFIWTKRGQTLVNSDLEDLINKNRIRFTIRSGMNSSIDSEDFNCKTNKIYSESILSDISSDLNKSELYKFEFLNLKATESKLFISRKIAN